MPDPAHWTCLCPTLDCRQRVQAATACKLPNSNSQTHTDTHYSCTLFLCNFQLSAKLNQLIICPVTHFIQLFSSSSSSSSSSSLPSFLLSPFITAVKRKAKGKEEKRKAIEREKKERRAKLNCSYE